MYFWHRKSSFLLHASFGHWHRYADSNINIFWMNMTQNRWPSCNLATRFYLQQYLFNPSLVSVTGKRAQAQWFSSSRSMLYPWPSDGGWQTGSSLLWHWPCAFIYYCNLQCAFIARCIIYVSFDINRYCYIHHKHMVTPAKCLLQSSSHILAIF